MRCGHSAVRYTDCVFDFALVPAVNCWAIIIRLLRGLTDLIHCAKPIRTVLSDEQVEVLSETRQTFLDGLTLYESRSDKTYSLTDCRSVNVMRKHVITDV